ncbi:MAG: ubiquinol-cytochrome c reductase iron-sulfur subunit [Chloroflexi bacterium]|nr:ubiquinol-cytochrome c reductase iron-sulfur subunit [Chloroflexota bacterium]
MAEDRSVSRRSFLTVATVAIGGVITAIMGIPAVAYIIGPALKKQSEQEWIPVGRASKVELGVPALFKVKIQRKAGWILNEQELSFYVLTEDGRDFIAMSNICTHLGCRARWVANEGIFFCPCHNGVFAKDGTVLGGPPPRPLDRVEVKVEDDQLFILGG